MKPINYIFNYSFFLKIDKSLISWLHQGWKILELSDNISVADILIFLSQLSKSYGNIYSIYIGPKPAVVLNGLKAMKEAIVIKAADFSGRPQDLFVNDVTKRNGRYYISLKKFFCFLLCTVYIRKYFICLLYGSQSSATAF